MMLDRDSMPDDRILDIEAVMKDIRERVKEEVKTGAYLISSSKTAKPGAKPEGPSPLLYSDELNYLNAHWHDWFSSRNVFSHRKFFGKYIVKAKKFFINSVWEYLLKDYADSERQFNMHLVRHLNANARYIDSRISDIFWQLISKIDSDVGRVQEELLRTQEEVRSTFVSLGLETRGLLAHEETERKQMGGKLAQLQSSLGKIEEMVRGLERGLVMISEGVMSSDPSAGAHASSYVQSDSTAAVAPGNDAAPTPVKRDIPDLKYYLFENRFRGSEEEILRRQEQYADLFAGVPGEILELGCGRGELLDTFRRKGLKARGVDLDTAMAARALEKGLSVEVDDAFSVLEKAADSSLGGVIALQFVEHLSNDQLYHLLDLSTRKLAIGGKVLFETINPQSFAALARNFFRDPTHRWPLHPDTLRMLVEMKGLKTNDIIYSAPYPASILLSEVAVDAHLPARWKHTIEVLNDNMRRLNGLLFDFQDYAILAEKVAGKVS